jgi:hypothetical protein
MAGQGWREWVAGEQLTDEKMQQFLMDQAVMRFANASARDTALSEVLSEGMVAYLDDLNTVEVYDGSEWTELTGDPDIFTQGTAGQYLQSNGTAGVDWADIDQALPRVAGLHFGRPGQKSSFSDSADTSYTIALGYNAAQTTARPNPSFIGNTAIGGNAGAGATTGHNNVFLGSEAGQAVTTGAFNVFAGTSSGLALTTGSGNTFLGHGTAFSYSDATNCTFVGLSTGARFSPFSSTGNNLTLLGYEAMPSTDTATNEITLGNSSITALRCQVTTISALSDIRDKTNVEELPYGVEFVKELKPVSFDWDMRDKARVGDKDFGFIAQDLAALEDKFDAERLGLTLRDNPDRLEATPGRLIPILVKAIQELTARVEELENAR